jgi:hypothetical protein
MSEQHSIDEHSKNHSLDDYRKGAGAEMTTNDGQKINSTDDSLKADAAPPCSKISIFKRSYQHSIASGFPNGLSMRGVRVLTAIFSPTHRWQH